MKEGSYLAVIQIFFWLSLENIPWLTWNISPFCEDINVTFAGKLGGLNAIHTYQLRCEGSNAICFTYGCPVPSLPLRGEILCLWLVLNKVSQALDKLNIIWNHAFIWWLLFLVPVSLMFIEVLLGNFLPVVVACTFLFVVCCSIRLEHLNTCCDVFKTLQFSYKSCNSWSPSQWSSWKIF